MIGSGANDGEAGHEGPVLTLGNDPGAPLPGFSQRRISHRSRPPHPPSAPSPPPRSAGEKGHDETVSSKIRCDCEKCRLASSPKLWLAVALLLGACQHAPAERLLIDLDQGTAGQIRITASSPVHPVTREAFLAGRDDWSQRFQHASASEERIIFEKKNGQLTFVEHAGTINEDNLQRFFSDVSVTVQVTRAEGWSELSIYPGTSNRATRPQREHFEQVIERWSGLGAQYLVAMQHLYAYLGEHPGRGASVYSNLLTGDPSVIIAATEQEEALLFDALSRMRVLMRAAPADDEARNLADEADLVLNPFPAEISVHLPGRVDSSDGFSAVDDRNVVARVPGLGEAIMMLRGRWLLPDPMAILIETGEGSLPKPSELASARRRAAMMVTPVEIANALQQEMKGAARYRVRWPAGE